ncbi:unnamed protein product [Calicophoron daubneyi]|uniref:Charged multivesicular body protein 6 n=1 Tax=Calicophoron daubneyi TaxID=300641 RepID=A0AAV2TM00_CALDB
MAEDPTLNFSIAFTLVLALPFVMGSLISSRRHHKPPAKSRVTEQDRAILQLKQQRDKLNQFSRRLDGQLSRERELAKRLLREGKKDKALLLLKKKHCIENLIERSDKQLNVVEQLINDVEFAQIEVDVVNGLRAGNEALKKIHQIMTLEDVERIMDETREAAEYEREIDAALAGNLTPQDTQVAESELEDLLRTMDGELPEVPRHEIPSVPDEEPESRERSRPDRVRVLAS